jgi:hypothetical protein
MDDSKYENDFDLLIKTSVELGNRLAGQKILDEGNSIYYAEGLAKKILNHIVTARYLMKGYHLGLDKNLYEGVVDFSSIAILTRAALETYLTFNHIYISPQDKDEQNFRFTCWNIAGYLERIDMEATQEKHLALKESEKLAIESIKKELNENILFKTLTPKKQNWVIVDGYWRIDKSWSDLAIAAGFRKEFFSQQYKFLCAHSHSSRLSVIQIQQNKSIDEQREMVKATMGVLMVILAKYMDDYVGLMPQLRDVKDDLGKYAIIRIWKTIGDTI